MNYPELLNSVSRQIEERSRVKRTPSLVNIGHRMDVVKRKNLALWNYLHRRVYKHAETYSDYRVYLLELFTILADLDDEKREVPFSVGDLIMGASVADKLDFPTFFVSPDVLQAVSQTSPPDEINWKEMHFPFESMNFVLPRKMLYADGHEIFSISFARLRKNNYSIPFWGRGSLKVDGQEFQMNPETEVLSIVGIDDHFIFHSRVLTKPYSTTEEIETCSEFFNDRYVLEMRPSDKTFNQLMTKIVFNLMFVMAAKPELVEAGSRIGRSKKEYNREIWTPNIIGRKYRIARSASIESDATRHVRLHWRRGHFRQQAYGKGLTEHKTIWIEPVLVGVTKVN